VRGNSIEQLTADHTLAAELEEMGEDAVSASERASHVLTRCLGNESDVEVDVTCGDLRLEDSDQVVLCSDGLSGLVDETEILQIVRAAAPDDACRELVELARARGGPDNITVLVGQLRAA
jgi:protein phosphatase